MNNNIYILLLALFLIIMIGIASNPNKEHFDAKYSDDSFYNPLLYVRLGTTAVNYGVNLGCKINKKIKDAMVWGHLMYNYDD